MKFLLLVIVCLWVGSSALGVSLDKSFLDDVRAIAQSAEFTNGEYDLPSEVEEESSSLLEASATVGVDADASDENILKLMQEVLPNLVSAESTDLDSSYDTTHVAAAQAGNDEFATSFIELDEGVHADADADNEADADEELEEEPTQNGYEVAGWAGPIVNPASFEGKLLNKGLYYGHPNGVDASINSLTGLGYPTAPLVPGVTIVPSFGVGPLPPTYVQSPELAQSNLLEADAEVDADVDMDAEAEAEVDMEDAEMFEADAEAGADVDEEADAEEEDIDSPVFVDASADQDMDVDAEADADMDAEDFEFESEEPVSVDKTTTSTETPVSVDKTTTSTETPVSVDKGSTEEGTPVVVDKDPQEPEYPIPPVTTPNVTDPVTPPVTTPNVTDPVTPPVTTPNVTDPVTPPVTTPNVTDPVTPPVTKPNVTDPVTPPVTPNKTANVERIFIDEVEYPARPLKARFYQYYSPENGYNADKSPEWNARRKLRLRGNRSVYQEPVYNSTESYFSTTTEMNHEEKAKHLLYVNLPEFPRVYPATAPFADVFEPFHRELTMNVVNGTVAKPGSIINRLHQNVERAVSKYDTMRTIPEGEFRQLYKDENPPSVEDHYTQ